MDRQLVVVVHGVGVREAGGATAQVSAALIDGQTSEAPWKPHSTDDFVLHEHDDFSNGALRVPFSAHMRRFRQYGGAGEQDVARERLIADFYWGDISATGNGVVRLMVGLFKIVLGLSHAIRENAYDVFPGPGRLALGLRRLARTAPLMIHGPIAAISIVLVAGLFLTLALHGLSGRALAPGVAEVNPIAVQGVLALSAFGGGVWMLMASRVYLQRHLAIWLMISAGLVALAAAGQWFWPREMQAFYVAVDSLYFGTECQFRPGCAYLDRGFVVLGAVLMAAMAPFWVVVIACGILVQLATWARPWLGIARRAVTPILAPAIALMAVLWLVLMMALWSMILLLYKLIAALFTFHLPLGLSENLVEGYLLFAFPALLAMALLGAVGLALHIRKNLAMSRLTGADYLGQRDRLAERHRLIVAAALLSVLVLFLVAMVVYGAFVLFGCRFSWTQGCTNIQDMIRAYVGLFLVAVGAIAVLIGALGQVQLATAVAIVTDVLVYLNDHSWRSREAFEGGAEPGQAAPEATRTLTERAMGLRKGGGTFRQGYWLRRRIQSRMHVLVSRLIADFDPSRLVIVSHSQGTVIALEAIARNGADWLRQMPEGACLKLVTMGSPYTHLYNTYFPSAFADIASRRPLQRRHPGGDPATGGRLDAWVNIFRRNDFVGTHIDRQDRGKTQDDGSGWPREIAIGPRGHTDYWRDTEVFPHLREVLAWPPSDGK